MPVVDGGPFSCRVIARGVLGLAIASVREVGEECGAVLCPAGRLLGGRASFGRTLFRGFSAWIDHLGYSVLLCMREYMSVMRDIIYPSLSGGPLSFKVLD